MTRVRVRQHVNPFHRKYQTALTIPDWSKVFPKVEQNFHLDIGCARGKLLQEMAVIYPNLNFLGVEIRESLVIEANSKARELGLSNLYYLFGNINSSIELLLKSLPERRLAWVTIQFPDPWFKNRHAKRRVAQPELVDSLSNHLIEGGTIFLQSDVELVALEMVNVFANHPYFIRSQPDWLEVNPLPVATERELGTIAKGNPVYRALFTLHKPHTDV